MPTLADLQRINTEVNQIPYNALLRSGEDPYIVKDTPDGGNWVCRDYAVRKCIEIEALGVLQSDCSLVICWTEPVMPVTDLSDPTSGRERHEVLAVHLDNQMLIMDSRFDQVDVWNVAPWTGYYWEHQQLAGTLEWRACDGVLI